MPKRRTIEGYWTGAYCLVCNSKLKGFVDANDSSNLHGGDKVIAVWVTMLYLHPSEGLVRKSGWICNEPFCTSADSEYRKLFFKEAHGHVQV